MKIFPKLNQSISRYMKKNTVRARYNRHMDAAVASGVAAVGHGITTATIPGLVPMHAMTPANLVINVGLWALYFKNLGSAIIERIHMRPIRKRAIAIKKAVKLAKKNLCKQV